MKKRNHSMEKRRQRLTEALLRTIAIVHHSELGSGEVRVVDTRRHVVIRPDEYQAYAITKRPQPWAVLLFVMTDDNQRWPGIATASAPCLQSEMVDELEEAHQELLAEVKTIIALEGNGVTVESYGWIAMPVQQDMNEEQAEQVFAAALRTIERVAA